MFENLTQKTNSLCCLFVVKWLFVLCTFSQVELELTLPGEGKDRIFKVALRWIGQVSLSALEDALEGRSQRIPIESTQALDVVMRHLPSMK